MRACLASGYPFVFGFEVYESFQGSRVRSTGILDMPRPREKVVGLHAVVAVGYDGARRGFLVRNSRKEKWGRGDARSGTAGPWLKTIEINLQSENPLHRSVLTGPDAKERTKRFLEKRKNG